TLAEQAARSGQRPSRRDPRPGVRGDGGADPRGESAREDDQAHTRGRDRPGQPRRAAVRRGPAPLSRRAPGTGVRMSTVAALHKRGEPLLLPNAWDAVTGAALAAQGFPAIGTTSLGVAAAAGKRDAQGDALDETVRLARLLAPLECFVTVDFEGG